MSRPITDEEAVAAADKEMEERANRAKELLSQRYVGLKRQQVSNRTFIFFCLLKSHVGPFFVSSSEVCLFRSFVFIVILIGIQNSNRLADNYSRLHAGGPPRS